MRRKIGGRSGWKEGTEDRHLREWKRKMVEDVGEFGEIEKKGNDGERWRE